MQTPVIRSKRLFLRRFQPSDYLDLHEYLSDPEVVRFEPYEPFNLKQSKLEALNRANSPCYWAVCLTGTNKVIGNLYFNKEDYETYELGFVFNRLYQKHGSVIWKGYLIFILFIVGLYTLLALLGLE